MRRWGWWVIVLLLWAAPVSAQPDVSARRIHLGTTGTTTSLRAGSGSPEGAETAPVGTQYLNITDGKWWRKATGSGNTGWVLSVTFTCAQFGIPWASATDTIGCTTALTLNGDLIHSTDAAAGISALRFSSNTAGARLSLRKTRGSAASPSVIVTGDVLGRVNFDGWDGDSTIQSASVVGASSGTIADGRIASELQFWTSTDAAPSVLTRRWTIDNAGHLLPFTTYTEDAGSDALKIRSLYAAELWVQQLTAAEVISTIGGQIEVAPTTILTADLASGGTTITLKHNNFSNGDRIVLKKFGQVEWMAIASVAGGSAGAYTYTVTRNLDGTGANNWTTGDAAMNTGTTGDGFIDLSSGAGLIPGSTVGPTIAFNVRTGTTWSDIATRGAIGNLNGLYGYVADTYGAAFGDNSAAWVKIDPTNGVRIGHNATTKVQIDASGNATFTGAITAASGTIGGWTIGADYIRDAAGVVGMSSAVTGGDDIRFWAGDATPSSAEFRVTESGAITATSGTIGGCTLASASITCGSADDVAVLHATDATYRIWAGNAAGASAPFSVDKDGYLRTSSATFGSGSAGVDVGSTGLTVNGSGHITAGGGDVVIDNDGILMATGAATTNRLRWSDGSYVGSNSGLSVISAGAMEIGASTGITIQGSDVYLLAAGTTTNAYYPLVSDGGDNNRVDAKTDGLNGTATCAGGQFVNELVVEYGILITMNCATPFSAVMQTQIDTLKQEVAELRELLAVVLRRDR